MKKILVLANNDMGLYKFRKELLIELTKQYEVYVSLPFGEYIDELRNIECHYIDTKMNRRGVNPFSDIKLILAYFKLVKKIQPHIILTYTIKPNIYGGLVSRMKRIPYITNITGLGTAIESQSIFSRFLFKFYYYTISKANIVFFQNSENMKKFIFKNEIPKSILLPGSGVNLDEYKALEYPKETPKTYLLYIGRIMKNKGIDELLRVSKMLKDKNIVITLVGSLDKNYNEIIQDYSNKQYIKHVGQTNDIKKYLLKSHALIHPSYHEGMSNVILEAAACERPIIASNIFGCKEIVDNNITGFLFQPKDSTDMYRKIIDFIGLNYEQKKQMGINARKKVEVDFDRNIIIKTYLEEIKNIGEKI